MTPKAMTFLDAYREVGTIAKAARLSGTSRDGHYRRIERDEEYRAAFVTAQEEYRDIIRGEVIRRAIEGWAEPVVYHGKVCKDKKGRVVTIRKFSDRMLELLARAQCPEFRDRHELTGPGGGPIQTNEASLRVEFVHVGMPDRELREHELGSNGGTT